MNNHLQLDWRQTLNENDVNLADLRGLRKRRATDREKDGSEMNGTHIIMAMKLLYSTGHSQPPPVKVE